MKTSTAARLDHHGRGRSAAVHVNGDRIGVEVIDVDWGRGYQRYRSNATELQDTDR